MSNTGTAVLEKTHSWHTECGIVYLSITSDGTNGPDWVRRLEGKGFSLSEHAKKALCSKEFKPTNGVTTRIAILKGTLSDDRDRFTQGIRDMAAEYKLTTPNAEAACLIRENFSDEDIQAMGFDWIVMMHDPIKDPDGDPHLLVACYDDGGRWLSTYYGDPAGGWNPENGFAFAVS